MKNFLTNKTFCSLDQLRAEIELTHNGEQVWVNSGGKNLDCMFIPGKVQGAEEGQMVENAHLCMPTVIICNPNAMVYEMLVSNLEWPMYYLERGCNVFIWNYRGFGRSEGTPSPSKMFVDADAVLEYLEGVKGCPKIGVHG